MAVIKCKVHIDTGDEKENALLVDMIKAKLTNLEEIALGVGVEWETQP